MKALILLLLPCVVLAAEEASKMEAPKNKKKQQTTGLPVPRFVTLKSNETNLRKGPNSKFPITWVYKRRGYPMQVVAEYESWRKLRDYDDSEGWVRENLISGIRNVVVINNKYKIDTPFYRKNELLIFRYPDENSYPISRVQFGVIGRIKKCEKEWCKIKFNKISGWALKVNLWGVEAKEFLN